MQCENVFYHYQLIIGETKMVPTPTDMKLMMAHSSWKLDMLTVVLKANMGTLTLIPEKSELLNTVLI